jgi:CHAT domain-containing protein
LKDGDQIIWVPTEALGILPIGLAKDAVTERESGRSFVIVNAPNLNLIGWASEYIAKHPPPSLAAIVNPTGNIAGLNLPFADFEGRFAGSLFRKDQVIELDQQNATESAVIDALKNRTYWHFASHGSFSWTDGRHSSLILRDEARLSVGDLIDAVGNVARPRLVVLSACETGLYDSRQNADEFVGLPAAFMRLGSAGVLGTLWQVDDVATAFLMIKFYEYHLRAGLPPPSALQHAQLWLRNATKAELIRTAQEAAKAAGINANKPTKLEELIKSRRRSRTSRYSSIWSAAQAIPSHPCRPIFNPGRLRTHIFGEVSSLRGSEVRTVRMN